MVRRARGCRQSGSSAASVVYRRQDITQTLGDGGDRRSAGPHVGVFTVGGLWRIAGFRIRIVWPHRLRIKSVVRSNHTLIPEAFSEASDIAELIRLSPSDRLPKFHIAGPPQYGSAKVRRRHEFAARTDSKISLGGVCHRPGADRSSKVQSAAPRGNPDSAPVPYTHLTLPKNHSV